MVCNVSIYFERFIGQSIVFQQITQFCVIYESRLDE